MNNKQNIDIEAIKTRANAATQGPWTQREIQDYSEIAIAGHSAIEQPLALVGSNGDADFIAHAPEDVAALLAEIERLTAELDTTNRRYNEINRYNVSCTKQCDKLLLENTDLKERLSSSIAECNALREDFTKYAMCGTTDPSPYCANKSAACVDDEHGWCIRERCNFYPNACGQRKAEDDTYDSQFEKAEEFIKELRQRVSMFSTTPECDKNLMEASADLIESLIANSLIQEHIIKRKTSPLDTDKIVCLTIENADLKRQLSESQRRETAAVEDMSHTRETCKHYDGSAEQSLKRDIPKPCEGCCTVDDNWEWRGPQEAEKGEANV